MTTWTRVIEKANAAIDVSLPPRVAGADPADALPDAAREKLLALRQDSADAHAIIGPLTDGIEEIRTQRHRGEAHIKRITGPAMLGGFGLADDDPQVVAEREKSDRLARELARLSGIVDERSARWQDRRRLVSALDQWAARHAGPQLQIHIGPAPKLGRGESIADAVERCRRRLRELRADLARTEAAPLPSSAAKTVAAREVARLAAIGSPNVASLVEAGAALEWPQARAAVTAWRDGRPDPHVPQVRTTDAAALLAWLNPAALLVRLEAEIDEVSDDANALTDEARAAKRAEILADMLAVERDEEGFIMQAAGAGAEIARRPDADPMAVLCVAAA